MRLLKIGSHPDCDIVLNSRKVSALHAEITLLDSGNILLEDKGSTNGTFVNNQPMQPGAMVPIKRGDLVRFADTELQWANIPVLMNTGEYKAIYGIGSNLRYNQIQVQGNTVSRFHATLKIDKKGRAFIEDHSMNGTTVNGKRITAHQDYRIKRSDDVVVGGVPVDLSKYLKNDLGTTILKIAGAVAAVAAVVLLAIWIPKINGGSGTNADIKTLMKATPCVIGAYYVEVTIKDNPINLVWPGIFPDKWQFGYDYSSGQWDRESTTPCMYYGTAFFISEYGELGTNRHIAVPWEYLTDEQKLVIKYQMREIVESVVGPYRIEQQMRDLLRNLGYYDDEYDDNEFWNIIFAELDKCERVISGKFEYLGVLLPGNTFTTGADLLACQVVAESGDPNKDVAMLRLNNPETPARIAKQKNGRPGYYLIKNARLDEKKLQISEPLQTVGYPAGLLIGMNMGNGEELNPTHHNATMSRKPDENRFQMQTIAMGGQSGSPVMDAKRNLVGVLCSGYNNNEITYCCNIKHLVELYNKYKWVD